jgi:hypothetical protein
MLSYFVVLNHKGNQPYLISNQSILTPEIRFRIQQPGAGDMTAHSSATPQRAQHRRKAHILADVDWSKLGPTRKKHNRSLDFPRRQDEPISARATIWHHQLLPAHRSTFVC